MEAVVAIIVVALACAILFSWILHARAAARLTSCRDHLGILARALCTYHDAHVQFPPAAVWSTDATSSLALHQARRIDIVTRENWCQLVLPFAGEEALAREFDRSLPIGHPANRRGRTTRLQLMNCADDSFNRSDNMHMFLADETAEDGIEFARGNYAINGGTHDWQCEPPNSAYPKGDFAHLEMRVQPRLFQFWGNGIAGINRSFSLDEFTNGRSTLVALEEVRAGIHPIDPRGVWAFGQIGGSITWGHGVNGDNYAPNHQWVRADDIRGCKALHEAVGTETVTAERMPCVDYVDVNQQATARSLHTGGLHVAFLDGAVRFISDAIDPGIWHVVHSRETPRDVLRDDFDSRLESRSPPNEAAHVERPAGANSQGTSSELANSIEMAFVRIPAGEFQMGIPDLGNADSPPPECPTHRVRITRPFWLGRHEVTRHAFRSVTGRDPSRHEAVRESAESAEDETTNDAGQMPVEQVSWHEAVEFCRILSELPAEKVAGRTYRLPTEAEWEYACRVGSDKPYEWHQQRKAGDDSGENSGILPSLPLRPVGSYAPNAFGLFDMRGNVWEWCADWFDRSYYSRSPVDDPQGPATGYIKVVRGSDWIFVGEPCLINYTVMPPSKANRFIGFRVVCDVDERAAVSATRAE